jgi:hypothetical protein
MMQKEISEYMFVSKKEGKRMKNKQGIELFLLHFDSYLSSLKQVHRKYSIIKVIYIQD